jgi:D-3-phosphoglycerate dehydrogenase
MQNRESFPKEKIKVLLLESISKKAKEAFNVAGYVNIKEISGALSEDELIEEIKDTHIIGIRSKTSLTKKVLESAEKLITIGCFCIGTNQVDLDAAAKLGIPVFNAPFSNTRSVAELTLASIVMLARKVFQRSSELHKGIWNKSAKGSFEVRKKTLGIIGYGHIGPQVGLLAEAFGMNVIYFDILPKLALGNAMQVDSLDQLLTSSDFVTLHVPETKETINMFNKDLISKMKKGASLINYSRGTVVDLNDLANSLKEEHLSGAAVDVFEVEPNAYTEDFNTVLKGIANVILTPHIGGSTIEAQENIGLEVAHAQIKFLDSGSTSTSAVNFPIIELPILSDAHRVLNVHKNVPGVLSRINQIIADLGANIVAQHLGTNNEVGYLIVDVDTSISREVKKAIDLLDDSIRTRLLF